MADENKTGSKLFSLNVADIMVVVKNALLVALAAFLTFIVQNLGNIEMGENALFIIPVITMALNTAIRFIKDYSTPDDEDDEDEEDTQT